MFATGCWRKSERNLSKAPSLAFLVKKYRPKKTPEEEAKDRLSEEVDRLSDEVDSISQRVEDREVRLKGQMAVLEEKLEAGRGYL
ncbi:hypothetical protein N7501_000176 [Penicillium viridicatum]|nr:hypothetical protein N7501_000176 [Penicillium viridicatum]